MALIIEKILEILKNQSKGAIEITEAMFCTRPESYRRLRASMLGVSLPNNEKKDSCREVKKIYDTLYYLKKGGFIKKSEGKDETLWSITIEGLRKLKLLKLKADDLKSYLNYTKEKIDMLVIVAFDIPEKLKRHRAWLRDALQFIEFKMIQKSVWMGNRKIPEQFIFDLKRKGILECVDIFEVGNKGTLNRVK